MWLSRFSDTHLVEGHYGFAAIAWVVGTDTNAQPIMVIMGEDATISEDFPIPGT